MSFTFMLATVLVTTTAVLGRSSGPSPARMTLVEEDQIRGRHDETGRIVAAGDRSSNLKYVMAIQSSSIWTEIKKRSLTINAPQRLDDAVADKSPNDLSDAELALLKQACHDGLKCVAVDQLLVLDFVRETHSDGYTSVRTAITKITEVITKYTDEYHEDVYQYEAVTQSDDPSKVYESVTTIVDDNKELCRIDDAAAENQRKKVGGSTRSAPPPVVNNDITVNYNAIENYNVNNGTVNSATVVVPPTVDGIAVTVASDDPAENRSPDRRHVDADTSTVTGDETAVKAVDNDVGQERARPNRARDSGTPDRRADPESTVKDHAEYAPPHESRTPAAQLLAIEDGPSDNGSADTDNGAGGRGARRPRADDGARAENVASVLNRPNGGNHDSGRAVTADIDKNTVTLENSAGAGSNDSDTDIVSAGSHNKQVVRKGMVEDGYFNNGNMKVKNFDRSNRNKGTIKDSLAHDGILNVGTVNNGPVNYGTSSDYTNNGTVADVNSFDVQKYADSIDKMYSAILNKLAKQ